MKILHFTFSWAPLGGSEYYAYNVCNELEKRGHENIIIHSAKLNTALPQNNRKIFFIDKIANFNCDQRKVDKALSIVKEENPDIVYLHMITNTNLIKDLIKLKPTIQYIHNHDIYCPSAFMFTRFFNCSDKFSSLCFISCLAGNCIGCKPFDAIRQFRNVKAHLNIAKKINGLVVASAYMKQRLIDNGIADNKISVIPYFIDPKETHAQQNGDNLDKILFVGRICRSKGLDYLIKALKHIKRPCRLIIVGDGYYSGYIKKLAQKLKIDDNIEFKGWLMPDELDAYYRQASVVVIPSIWPEPFGIVGIEAMSYAKPVVAFDVGGVRQWLNDGKNGFLAKPEDILSLADKINTLLDNKELRIKFGKNGSDMANINFSPQRHIDSLINMFTKVSRDGK